VWDREAKCKHDEKQTSLFFSLARKVSCVPLEVDVNGEELFIVDNKVLLLALRRG
jgi:hypothetical protein